MKVETIATATILWAPFRRPTVLISDVHRNTRGPHNNCQSDLLIEFLRTHCPPGDWDLFELGDNRDVWEALDKHQIILDNRQLEILLGIYNGVHLFGNHDAEADAPGKPFVYDRGGAFLWHGHQLDPACRGRGTLGRIASVAWAAAERLYLGRLLGGFKTCVQRWSTNRIRTASRRGGDNRLYIADAAERAADGICLYVNGHTHKPQLAQLEGCIYANPGSWVGEGRGYAVTVVGRDVSLLAITA